MNWSCFSITNPMDRTSILIWNVRGLNDKARRDNLRKVVDEARPAVICLQETKMVAITRQTILSMLGSDFDNNFICLPSVGASGGILIAWRRRLGAAQASRVDTHSVSVQFCSANGIPWWLTTKHSREDTILTRTPGYPKSMHRCLDGGRGLQPKL